MHSESPGADSPPILLALLELGRESLQKELTAYDAVSDTKKTAQRRLVR